MISKLHRFHGHGSLNFVYRKGHTFRGDYVSLRVAPSRDTDFRMAVVVSKKVSKSAVVRNRIRRRVYEVVRVQRKTTTDVMWPYDMVFTVFDQQVATVSSPELATMLVKLIKKAGIPATPPDQQ